VSRELVRLGDVCEIRNGATPKTEVAEFWGGPHQWLTPAEMGGRNSPFVSTSTRTLTDAGLASCSASLSPPNSVILSCRAPIGHLAINVVPMATNQGCKTLVPSSALDFQYLYYFLAASRQMLDELGTGATFRELSAGKLSAVTIPLRPMDEQRRIVSLLDEATQLIADLEFAFAQTVGRYEELASSAVRRAFEPTPDVRLARLQDVAEVNPSEPALSEDSPFVPMDAVHVGKRDIQYTEPRGTRSGARARAGDVLFARITPCLQNGKVALVQDEFPRCGGSTEFIVVRADSELLREYLYYWITSPRVRELAVSMMTGATGRQRLNAPDLAALEIPVPALSEQRRVVMELDDLDVVVSGGVSLARQRLDRAVDLRQSVLEAAFRGGL
jgi:type I restriction enzyme S subunit